MMLSYWRVGIAVVYAMQYVGIADPYLKRIKLCSHRWKHLPLIDDAFVCGLKSSYIISVERHQTMRCKID